MISFPSRSLENLKKNISENTAYHHLSDIQRKILSLNMSIEEKELK